MVSGFCEAGHELLYDVYFDEDCKVRDSAGANEPVFEWLLLGGGISWGVEGVWEEALREVVLCCDIEGGGFVVAETETHDYGFVAETVDLNEVAERRLRVCIAEAVGARGGIPVWWERFRVGAFDWSF